MGVEKETVPKTREDGKGLKQTAEKEQNLRNLKKNGKLIKISLLIF